MVGTGKKLVNFSDLYQRTLNDKNAVKELIVFFLINVDVFLLSSEEAIHYERTETLLGIAKKIKNGAKHIYSDKILEIASDMELSCYDKDFNRAFNDINALKTAIDDLKKLESLL